ncbi:LLM class flavin-dependent oxidoreductase [Aquibacillus albus]|uniref:Luciferase family oxidoreductase group 1 n=1 Tax=Aquibacillus albus TaxID=1168171 RepID=A0ABS2MXX9_9BACI|nr:LLM class flavin-dependent oxidoreductase [Aquibacillus albus]MBM7570648.1 luciferase family oxidoreductase group 1 [Aquibacillus albus]
MIRLSILDQTVIPQGGNAGEELQNTVKLAQIAERLGYHRFWISEHHLETLGHSSPEVFIPHIAANTTTIRVGSGGVMLPHYSAYKVAENFRLLEALYPGRIDLGVGRAPGGMPLATMALQEHKQLSYDNYPEQVSDLIYYLTDSNDPNHRFKGLKAMPAISSKPSLWLLGSSGGSAGLAAQNGISYAFAPFISGHHGGGIVENYQQTFQRSAIQERPNNLVAFFVVCGETDAEAEFLAMSFDIHFLQIAKGEKISGMLSPEQANNYQLTENDRQIMKENRKKVLIGSPQTIKNKITTLSKQYNTNEFMLASMLYDFHDKVKGYQLLSEAFDLRGKTLS